MSTWSLGGLPTRVNGRITNQRPEKQPANLVLFWTFSELEFNVNKVTTDYDKILGHIQKLLEEDLTKQFVMPLMRAIGYFKVEYKNGPSEQGKDVLCWKKSELDELELTVVQVKLFKPRRKAASEESFSEIITQLSQAIESKVPTPEGEEVQPSGVYFVSPHAFDTDLIMSRSARIPALRAQHVKIIDGPRLVRLIMRHLPHLAQQVIDQRSEIHSALRVHLSNSDLLRVLDYKRDRDIRSYYTDLEFFVGSVRSKPLLSIHDKSKVVRFRAEPAAWESIKKASELARLDFSLELLRPSATEIECEYLQSVAQYDQERLGLVSSSENISSLQATEREGEQKLEALIESLKSDADTFGLYQDFKLAFKALARLDDESSSETSDIRDSKLAYVQELETKLEQKVPAMAELRRAIEATRETLKDARDAHRGKVEAIIPPMYEGEIDGKVLAQRIHACRLEILRLVKKYNERTPVASELAKFVAACERFLVFGEILGHSRMKEGPPLPPLSCPPPLSSSLDLPPLAYLIPFPPLLSPLPPLPLHPLYPLPPDPTSVYPPPPPSPLDEGL